jgi:hypothetical protein
MEYRFLVTNNSFRNSNAINAVKNYLCQKELLLKRFDIFLKTFLPIFNLRNVWLWVIKILSCCLINGRNEAAFCSDIFS